jgi:septal ring factor EnvC (AmiA/AmiB activator)
MRWCVLLFTISVSAASAEPAPQQKLNQTLKSLESSKEKAAQLEGELSATRSDLSKLQARATDMARKLQDTEARATREERAFDKASGELGAKQREFEARSAEYTDTIRSLIRMQQLPPTFLFADPKQAETLLKTAAVLQKTNQALAARAESLGKEVATLARLKKRSTAAKMKVDEEQERLSNEQKALKSELSRRQQVYRTLSRDFAQAESEVAALSRQSQDLQELIRKLEARPNVAGRTSTPKTAGARVSRGSMRPPVVGEIIHRFGERKNDNETYRGMVIRARAGSTVVAPAGGVVVFTGPFRDYGRMVLIKHGNGFISLLAGLGTISVNLNQEIGKAEPLGNMGGNAARLYVELREGSKPIDPTGWFATVTRSLAER